MSRVEQIKSEINQYINEEKALFYPLFFQAFAGGYGEGDCFVGVTVPNLRKVAKKYYKTTNLPEAELLLQEPFHEYRLTGLFVLVYKFEKAETKQDRQAIVNLYLSNLNRVNNWDLVDSSADKVLGAYLFDKDKSLLYELAGSNDLWKQRIAIIATFHFIKQGHYQDTLEIAKILLDHKHDLIHKAVGWMLREIGNRDFNAEYNFLKEHYKMMPRTMLRYAIEKFEPELRQGFLKGLIEFKEIG